MHFGDMPDEIREALESQMQRAEMAGSSFRHEVNRLVQSLDVDELITFKALMNHLHSSPESAFFLEGVATATLEIKHNLCGGCGKDHDKEMLSPQAVDNPVDNPVDDGTEQLPLFEDNPTKTQADADQYGVTVIEGGRVACKECSMVFASLDDRMRRDPGVKGCAGCQDKAKWG